MTVHRYIPAAKKHEAKTACGIRIASFDPGSEGWKPSASTLDGSHLDVTEKGEPFDCKRCRSVLELRHQRDDRMRISHDAS